MGKAFLEKPSIETLECLEFCHWPFSMRHIRMRHLAADRDILPGIKAAWVSVVAQELLLSCLETTSHISLCWNTRARRW